MVFDSDIVWLQLAKVQIKEYRCLVAPPFNSVLIRNRVQIFIGQINSKIETGPMCPVEARCILAIQAIPSKCNNVLMAQGWDVLVILQ